MIAVPTYSSERKSVALFLLNEIGAPPLPVSPAFSAEDYPARNRDGSVKVGKDGKPLPAFTGKNPSYLDAQGIPHLVNHRDYQERMPTKEEMTAWFSNPANGIGTLGGWSNIIWLDWDAKQFDDAEQCAQVFFGWLDAHPELKNGWWEKTHSGGYRVAVRCAEAPGFTNFKLGEDGWHVGEALGAGRFTVLAPTVGPSGNPYVNQNRALPIEVESLEALGILSTRSKRDHLSVVSAPLPSSGLPGSIPLEQLGHDESRRIINGEDTRGDRSESLTAAIQEWAGWLNWCNSNGIATRGTVEELTRYAGERLGMDAERCDRILATVDLASCHPAAVHRGGDQSCWLKVRRLDRATFEAKCPPQFRGQVDPLGIERIGKPMPLPTGSVEVKPAPEGLTDEERLRHDVGEYLKVKATGNLFQVYPMQNAIAREHGISKSQVEELARVLERGTAGDLTATADILIDTFEEIESRSAGVVLPGIPCSFYDLDAMTQGFQRSDLIIAAGRPSMGKTAFCLNVARNIAAIQKMPVTVFSLEMSKLQLVYRLLSSEVEIESSRLRSGRIATQEWEKLGHAINALSQMPLYIDDTPQISVAEIGAKCRRLQAEQGCLGLILIDYLQLMEGDGDNRVLELSRITRGLKGLARELNTPIIALSQLSRAVEQRTNKRPMMSDLRESGGIEQDSDLIMMLYREDYYEPDTPDRGLAEVIIAKHRNGPTGTIKLLFEPQFTRFRNLAKA